MAVRVFELREGRPHLVRSVDNLGESSAALPAGAYSTLRTYGGQRVVRLEQHLQRLEESAALLGKSGRLGRTQVRAGLRQLLPLPDGVSEARLRLTFAPPQLFIAVEPFIPLAAEVYERGVACVTVPLRRENPRSKDTRFIAAAACSYGSLPVDVNEGLMLGPDGAILEGLSSNFFAVRGGVLRTENERALAGVTRGLVLEVAAQLLPVELRAVCQDELGAVEECFLTSVSREVLPVVRIDGLPIGDGRPGPRTRAIARDFAGLVEREAESP